MNNEASFGFCLRRLWWNAQNHIEVITKPKGESREGFVMIAKSEI